MHEIRAEPDGNGLRVAVVVARYNATITDGLLSGTLDELARSGVADDDILVVHVPGALEIPVTAAHLAHTGQWHGIVALGAVIEGETDHYTHVCSESLRGCSEVALSTGVPVGFGVLTCRTLLQARDRSSTPAKNKGREAAHAVLTCARTLEAINQQQPDGDGP